MRRFPFVRLLMISSIVGLALISVYIQEVNISVPGINLSRGSESILGLQLGLDLEGGSHLIYEAIPEDGQEPTADQMEGVIKTIERRVNSFGVAEPVIQQMGGNRILVQLPGVGVTKGTLTLLEDTPVEKVAEVFSTLGRQNAVIEAKGNRQFEVKLPSLKPAELGPDGDVLQKSEKDIITSTIQEHFPASLVNITFPQTIAKVELETLIHEQGRPDATVTETSEDSFSIEFPDAGAANLNDNAPNAGAIINIIQSELSSFSSLEFLGAEFVVTGGVEEAKKLIGQTAQLELMERMCLNDPNDFSQSCDDPEFHVDSSINLTGDDLLRAYAGTDPNLNMPVVNLEFNSEGAKIFAEHTQDIAGTNNRTAFFLDDELLIAPVAREVIAGGRAFIQGPDFTMDRVRTIAIQLESGRLQVPMTLIQEQDVDATLGKDSLAKSVLAGMVGLGLVLLFMAMYYRLPGLLACIALVIYSVLVLAVLKLWPITLTLGGLAAFILSIGMAVDANILIFERMKEELRSGRTLIASIETGFNRAWPAIRDSNVSTFITCAILFWFGTRLGTGLVTGFAVTLAIGVAASMFSALTVTRTLLRIVAISPIGRYTSLYTPVPRNPDNVSNSVTRG